MAGAATGADAQPRQSAQLSQPKPHRRDALEGLHPMGRNRGDPACDASFCVPNFKYRKSTSHRIPSCCFARKLFSLSRPFRPSSASQDSEREKMANQRSNAPLVLLLIGATRSGKSSFIQSLTNEKVPVHRSDKACTYHDSCGLVTTGASQALLTLYTRHENVQGLPSRS